MASGRYTPIPVGNAGDVTTLNQNLDNISEALDNVVSRQPNNLPNSMNTSLDMNGYPILNQSNPNTLQSFNWRGEWVTATAYNIGDAVFYNSSSYLCGIANTSAVQFLTDLLANRWTLIAEGTIYRGTWSGPNTAYFQGDVVFVSPDALYYCVTDHFSDSTFSNDLNAGYWDSYIGTLGTMAVQNANAVAITGGSISGASITTNSLAATGGTVTGVVINNSTIGATTPNTAKFTTATDSGAAPSTGAQLTNKLYVDGAITTNTNGICLQLGNGVKFQYGSAILPNSGVSGSAVAITFPVAFSNTNYQLTFNTQFAATAGGDKAIPMVNGKTTTGCTLTGDVNSVGTFNQTVTCGWIAIGS